MNRRDMRAVPVDDKMAVTIKKVGVIGSGQMGNGIAQVASLADHKSIRDAHRYRQLLNVQDVALHLTAPIPLDPAVEVEAMFEVA